MVNKINTITTNEMEAVSRAILCVLFVCEHELYLSIEMIIQAISVSCVKFGVESVVESHVRQGSSTESH